MLWSGIGLAEGHLQEESDDARATPFAWSRGIGYRDRDLFCLLLSLGVPVRSNPKEESADC
jgi:hypothetical protein